MGVQPAPSRPRLIPRRNSGGGSGGRASQAIGAAGREKSMGRGRRRRWCAKSSRPRLALSRRW
jgi:hypothetical protein